MKLSLADIVSYCAKLELSNNFAIFTEVSLDEKERRILKDIIKQFNLRTPQDFRYKLWKIWEYLLDVDLNTRIKILYHLYKYCAGLASVLKILKKDIEGISYDNEGRIYIVVNKKPIKTNIVLPERERIEITIPSKITVQIGAKCLIEGFINPPLTTEGVFSVNGILQKIKIVHGKLLLEIPPLEKPGKYLGELRIETPCYTVAKKIHIEAKGYKVILNMPNTIWVNDEIEVSGVILGEKLPKSLKIFLDNHYLAECKVNKEGKFKFSLPPFSKSGIFGIRLKGKNVDIEKKLIVRDLIMKIDVEEENIIGEEVNISGNITLLPENKPFIGNISIAIPEANVEEIIDAEGFFEYKFKPEKIGNYKIIVSAEVGDKKFKKVIEIKVGNISLNVKHPNILFEGKSAEISYEVVSNNISLKNLYIEVFVNGKRIYRGNKPKYTVTTTINKEAQIEVIVKKDKKMFATYKGTIQIIKLELPKIPEFLRIGEKYEFEIPAEVEVSCENCEVLEEEDKRIIVIGPYYSEGKYKFRIVFKKDGLEKEFAGTINVEGVVIEAESKVEAQKVTIRGKIFGKQSKEPIDDTINIVIRKSGKVIASEKTKASNGVFVKEFKLKEEGLYNADIISEKYNAKCSLEVSIRGLDVECDSPKEVAPDLYLIKGRIWLIEKERIPLKNEKLIMRVENQTYSIETGENGYFEVKVRLPKDKSIIKVVFEYKDLYKTINLKYSELEIVPKLSRTIVNPAEAVGIKVIVKKRRGSQLIPVEKGIVTCEVLDDKGKTITSRTLKYDSENKLWVGTIIAPPLPGTYPIKVKVKTIDGVYGEAVI